jgi:hypothetical protein
MCGSTQQGVLTDMVSGMPHLLYAITAAVTNCAQLTTVGAYQPLLSQEYAQPVCGARIHLASQDVVRSAQDSTLGGAGL